MNNNNFGKKLRALRKSKVYTQETLAEKAGIDEKHLSRIENGKFFPTYKTLTKILNVLNLSIEKTGLELNQCEINTNPIYIKTLQILNSACNDKELMCYFDSLKNTQKILNRFK